MQGTGLGHAVATCDGTVFMIRKRKMRGTVCGSFISVAADLAAVQRADSVVFAGSRHISSAK